MISIALFNLKGGVGKTLAAVNLAALAAASGERSLLWDLDPQAAATFCLGLPPSPRGTGRRIAKGKPRLSALIRPSGLENLDLVPAGLGNRKLDVRLSRAPHARSRLARLLEPLADQYRWVFLDCPAGLDLLAESVFRAAHLLAIPLIPAPLSLRSFETLAVFYEKKGYERSRLAPFFSMVLHRKQLHRRIMALLAVREPGCLKVCIPFRADIERTPPGRPPIALSRPRSTAGQAFQALWQELRARALLTEK
jgi:cellulose biosynthesis protein BcsQ